jgi:ribonuclease P protein component
LAARAGKKFGPARRLRSAAEFLAVLRAGKRLSTRHFQLSFRRNEHAIARLGITVPKRYAKKAVLRNRIKRICRESFRSTVDRLLSFDFVIRLSAVTRESDASLLRTEIDRLFEEMRETPAGNPD